ncbi:hypothetical protein Tco_0097871 [Tanacetum coccineum]
MVDHPAKEAIEISEAQPARRGLETYSSVSAKKQKLIDAEAEAVHIILTGIDNDIYSTVDACANAKETWLAIECLMHGENINKQDTRQYENQTVVNVVGNSDSMCYHIVQQTGIQYYNCKGFRHTAREYGVQLSAEQHDWILDSDEEPIDHELEAHYMYMAKIQEVIPAANEGTRPIFDKEPLEQCDSNTTLDSSDLSNNGGEAGKDEQKFQEERDLLASLIENMKHEIYESKKMNKCLKAANTSLGKELVRWQFNTGPSTQEILKLQLQLALEYLKKNLETFKQTLKEEMVEDLRYFNSLEKEVESLQSQLELQQTQFSNEIDCLLKKHFYNDHMDTLLGFFTNLDEYSEMQCLYLEKCQECESLEF